MNEKAASNVHPMPARKVAYNEPAHKMAYQEIVMEYGEITIPAGTQLKIPTRSSDGLGAPEVQILDVRVLPYDNQEVWKYVLIWR
ncbi:MAG: hypothetical protein ACXVHB_05855 [Solirubrobacteraceae bacterium]